MVDCDQPPNVAVNDQAHVARTKTQGIMTRKTVTPSLLAGSSATATSMRWCANPLVEWLLTEGWNISATGELIGGLCRRIVAEGIPLSRMYCFVRTLHPQVFATGYTWRRGSDDVEEISAPHSAVESALHLESPCASIFDGAATIRRRLDIPDPQLDFPILVDLLDEGATDFMSIPVRFSDGQINVVSVTADRPGGFSTEDLRQIQEMLPVFGRLIEVQVVRRNAVALLDTYLGKHTGERVLDGLIKRGDGEDIHAVIWYCDLRDSTELADSMSRDEFLGILNAFFDCMAGSVLDHGGEVLSFIGDAALAIFPTAAPDAQRRVLGEEHACETALAAAEDARERIETLNHQRVQMGEPLLRFGLALHMGDVIYGNVGVPNRLAFTVIGAAANEAARLQDLCKSLDESILISGAFADCFPGKLISHGHHTLRGVGAPQEVFILPKRNG